MKILTKELVKNDSKIKVSNSGEKIIDKMPLDLRVTDLLQDGSKTTKEIYKSSNYKKRTVRKVLSNLENKKIVKRTEGRKINKSFRFSDKWRLVKRIEIKKVVPENYSYLWYSTSHYNKGYKNHYMFIPKEIPLNELIVSSCGLLVAEATKTNPKSLEFVNSEPVMIQRILDFFKFFKISPEKLKWRIIFNGKLKRKYTESDEKASREFWLKTTKLSPNNEQSSSPHYTKNTKGKMRKNVPWGSTDIYYNNTIFRRVILKLLEHVKEKVIGNRKLAVYYLKGYLAGEAYVGSYDRAVQFASVNNNELAVANQCLNLLDIKSSPSKATSTSPPRIIITNLDGFLKLYKNDIFELNPYKKLALLNKILQYKKVNNEGRENINKDMNSVKIFIKNRDSIFSAKRRNQ
ncbi:MAG: helix-turn-helix domain-containing protein [Candidatus Aenigmatarchaeota archaeon]